LLNARVIRPEVILNSECQVVPTVHASSQHTPLNSSKSHYNTCGLECWPFNGRQTSREYVYLVTLVFPVFAAVTLTLTRRPWYTNTT